MQLDLTCVYFLALGTYLGAGSSRSVVISLRPVWDLAQLIEAMHLKLEGRGFGYRWRHWDFGLGVDSASDGN
jgi:hypothetical protein